MRWLTLLPLTLSLVTAGSATSPLFSDSLAVHEATHSTWTSHDGMSAFSKRASKAISSYSGPKSGHATFYGNDPNGGNCKLDRKDWRFVAFPGAKWDSAAQCGACIRVKGPQGSVDVQVTNKMTFSKIAPLSKGIVPITWSFISCVAAGLEKGKTSVVWKTGSSPYWMGIQIRGAALPIAKVSIRPANGSKYTNLKREDFNYFVAPSGVGAGPFVVLVRYQNGSKQIIKGVKLNSVIGDA